MATVSTFDRPDTERADGDTDEPECLACHLERRLPSDGCDGGLRLTRAWYDGQGRRVPVRWLEEQGGFCDCEVSFNVLGTGERSARHRELQCDDSYQRTVGDRAE